MIATKHLKMTATSHNRHARSRGVPHKAGSSPMRSKGRVVSRQISFEFRQEQCLHALRIAQTNSKLFTTALTAKFLYGSGKFDDEILSKLLDNISQAMEVANDCTKANSCTILAEIDGTAQDVKNPRRGFDAAKQSPVPPSA